MSYVAPVKDMLFCMKELAGLEAIAAMPSPKPFARSEQRGTQSDLTSSGTAVNRSWTRP